MVKNGFTNCIKMETGRTVFIIYAV